jgi:uncharacterized membrane protein
MGMDDLGLARAVHVLGVVLWIGGVGFVTTILLPALERLEDPVRRLELFEALEGRFGRQAKLVTLVTALSGFYLLFAFDAWDRFGDPGQWWLHAMVCLWLVFSLILFVLEPLFLHAWFVRRAKAAPEKTFTLVKRLHQALLAASLLTVGGAVVGVHG